MLSAKYSVSIQLIRLKILRQERRMVECIRLRLALHQGSRENWVNPPYSLLGGVY